MRYGNTINQEELERHVTILASDELEGRETGEAGQFKAAEYIALEFKRTKLRPVGDSNTHYQYVPLIKLTFKKLSCSFDNEEYNSRNGFWGSPVYNGDTNIVDKEIIFLGYGIVHENYNDYDGVMVKDKVIMIMDGEPQKNEVYLVTGDSIPSGIASRTKKIKTATKNGVKAIIFVVDPSIENSIKHKLNKPAFGFQLEDTGTAFCNSFIITESVANKVLAKRKQKIKKIKSKINGKREPINFSVFVDVAIEVQKNKTKLITQNVVGYLEGKEYPEEVIVVTAHYDHLGKRDSLVFNGADDNASGTAAVLELADAFSKAAAEGFRPKRSILFMPVSGEEKGLLGSRYYTDHPIFPLDNTVANINIDMIGRIDDAHEGNANYIYIIGSDMLSSELHEVNEQANELYTALELDYTYNTKDDPNRFYYRSDHYNFVRHDIPSVFYFSGVHEDYHKHTDTIEKLHWGKMESISRLIFYTIWELANRDVGTYTSHHSIFM